MPAPRAAFTFNDSAPLVPEHEEPVGVGAATGGAAGAEEAEGAEGAEEAEEATDCTVVVLDGAPVAVDPEFGIVGAPSSAQPGNRHADSTKVEASINGKYTLSIRVRARSSALVIESLFIKISSWEISFFILKSVHC
jgi:hypothetical protein